MTAPWFKYGLFGDEFSLVLAVVIGFGFGFFLERAGFGHSPKLAAQFYLTDMTVFKVMFTSIVTAMIGSFYLSYWSISLRPTSGHSWWAAHFWVLDLWSEGTARERQSLDSRQGTWMRSRFCSESCSGSLPSVRSIP